MVAGTLGLEGKVTASQQKVEVGEEDLNLITYFTYMSRLYVYMYIIYSQNARVAHTGFRL